MSAVMENPGKAAQTSDLLSAHTEAIKNREKAETSGQKAGWSRRIHDLELDMTLAGVRFKPYAPSPTGEVLTDAQIEEQHQQLLDLLDNKELRKEIRATATRRMTNLERVAKARELTL